LPVYGSKDNVFALVNIAAKACNTDSEIHKNRLSIRNSAVDENSIKYTAIGCRNDNFERQPIKIKSLKIAIFPQG